MSDESSATARLADALWRTSGTRWTLHAAQASSFCATWRLDSASQRAFLKVLPSARGAVFHAEADGLRALAATGAVRVPAVLFCADDAASGQTLLALDWLDLRHPDAGFGPRLGQAMAALHAAAPPALPQGVRFGWRRDNWLGVWAAEGC